MEFLRFKEGDLIGGSWGVIYSGKNEKNDTNVIMAKQGNKTVNARMWKDSFEGKDVYIAGMHAENRSYVIMDERFRNEGAFEYFVDRSLLHYEMMGRGGFDNLKDAANEGFKDLAFGQEAGKVKKEKDAAGIGEYKAFVDLEKGEKGFIYFKKVSDSLEKFEVMAVKSSEGKVTGYNEVLLAYNGLVENAKDFNEIMKKAKEVYIKRGAKGGKTYIDSFKEAVWRKKVEKRGIKVVMKEPEWEIPEENKRRRAGAPERVETKEKEVRSRAQTAVKKRGRGR